MKIDQSASRGAARADPLAQAMSAAGLAYSEPRRARRLADLAVTAAPADAEVRAVAERARGMADAAEGKLAAAREGLARAADAAEEAGLPERSGETRGFLAYILVLTSGAAEAMRELDRADALLRPGPAAARVQMQRGLVLVELHRYDEALASLDRALRTLESAGGDALLEADIRNNRGLAFVGRRDWVRADREFALAEQLYAGIGHHGRTAMVAHNRAIVLGLRGEIPAALAAFDDAAERYLAAGMHPGLLGVDRAEVLMSARLVTEARAAAGDAVAEFTRQHNAVDLVQALLLLSDATLLAGDLPAALAHSQRARRVAARRGLPHWAALADYIRLRARWAADPADPTVLAAGRRTAAALDRAGWVVQALDARLLVARTALRLDRLEEARRELAGMRAARRSGPAQLRAQAWHAEALLRRASGQPAGAARAVRAGLDIIEAFQASLGASELRAHAGAYTEDLAGLGVELALESGRAAAVLSAAERGRAGAIRLRPARPPDDPRLAADLSELRQLTGEMRAGTVDPRSGLARQVSLETRIRSRARHASGSAPPLSGSAERSQLIRALGDTALVEYLEVSGQMFAVVVGDGRPSVRQLGPAPAIAALIEQLVAGLRWIAYGRLSPRSASRVVELVARSSEALDALLLRPLLDTADGSALVVVPTGALHNLPWAALPSVSARPFSIAPSAALWLRARRTPDRAGPVVVAHGPGLEHAAGEVAALARLYPGVTRFGGSRARVGAVLEALDGAALAHIAAHGLFRSDNPMFCQLQLADGPLTVYDLERLAVAPRQVVLASCDSGRSEVHRGDELMGMTAALLSMGTVSLIASVVPVPDRASRAVMLRFHRRLRAGDSAAAALARVRADIGPLTAGTDLPLFAAAAGFACFGAG